ncbi:MAG: M28 family peptidase [Armatimonadota bacterium]
MKRIFWLPLAAAALALGALSDAPRLEAAQERPAPRVAPAVRQALEAIDAQSIRAHVRFLSDDLLEGRDTSETGGFLAARYLAAELEQLGLKPAGDNGSYYQQVPFEDGRMDFAASRLTLVRGGNEIPLRMGEEFLLNGGRSQSAELQAPLLFVGYGITAPEYRHDDYAGLDPKGKVVVVLTGEPESDRDDYFEGKRDTRHAQGGAKVQLAASKGAVGVITILAGERAASFPWDRFRSFQDRPSFRLADERAPLPALVVREEGAKQLFSGAGRDWEKVRAEIPAGKVAPQALPGTIRVVLKEERVPRPAPNVLAMLEGTDPELKKQVVVYSAHYDHVGQRPQGEGDRVFNGAWDNASGTAGVLEVARGFAHLKPGPRRSILFLFVTGEEKGLLGSQYYVRNPAVPMEQTAANINLDMTDIFGVPKELVAQGAEFSSIGTDAEVVAGELGVRVGKDPTPELGVFTRSDQFSFVQAGVPSVFMRWANEHEGMTPEQSRQMWQQKMQTIYHKPADEFDPSWSWEGMRHHAQQSFLLGLRLANEAQMPRWNEDSRFNRPRGLPGGD